MRLFLDIDSREFLQSPSFPRALTTLALKRRDTDLIELQFIRDRVVQDLPTGTTIRLGLKPANSYTAEFLATGTFTKSGTGTATRYLLDLNLNTVALNEAFAAATPEPVTLAAMLEVEWASGTTISSSLTLPVTINNDVIRGDEGEPVDLPIFYITETNDLQATQAEAEAGTNNTKWMSPLRTAEAIAALAATDWDSIADKPDAFPPSTHSHAISDTTGLQAALDGKASSSHTHAIADTTGLQSALDGKQAAGSFAPADHTHELSSLTQSSATSGQVPTWNGTAWAPADPSGGGGEIGAGPFTVTEEGGGDSLYLAPDRISSSYNNTTISFEEGILIFDGTNVLNWGGDDHIAIEGGRFLRINDDNPLEIAFNSISNTGFGFRIDFEEGTISSAFGPGLWLTDGKVDFSNNRLSSIGAPVDDTDAVRKIDLASKAAVLTQQVTSITGTSNHSLTINRWHIFTSSPSSGNHTFTLPQNATNGDLVYITFLTSNTTGFQVMRFGYEGGSPQVLAGNFETGKTYLFHYNDFDTARWRKVDWDSKAAVSLSQITQSAASDGQVPVWNGTNWVPQTPASGGGGGVSSWNDLTDKPSTFPPSEHNHDASAITSGTLNNSRTTATSSNSTGAIVSRDNSGNFSAGTITASLTGTASGNALSNHTHGNLTNAGAIGNTSGLPIITGTNGVLQAGSFGTAAGTFAAGNHTHSEYVTNSGGITAIAVVSEMPNTPNPNTLYIVQ
jgi:hypothetical protein